MTLIKSISGIRGTIGGSAGENLSPFDIVKYTSAYAHWLNENLTDSKKVVVGRDARPSGKMIENIIVSTLISMGFDVVNIGLATTPTTELAVIDENAAGGIIITASHNPKNWNALKLLNNKGEFLNADEGNRILELAEKSNFEYSKVEEIGKITKIRNYENNHINSILKLKLV
ncbi:MAG: phosphoglucosamine mutase, partial [Bacteroidales bacterium]|nr:phosphoglucosamine mutase [Bacteroidales bacterium]